MANMEQRCSSESSQYALGTKYGHCAGPIFLDQLNIYAVKSTDEPRSSDPIGQTVATKLLKVVEKSPEITKSRPLISGKK